MFGAGGHRVSRPFRKVLQFEMETSPPQWAGHRGFPAADAARWGCQGGKLRLWSQWSKSSTPYDWLTNDLLVGEISCGRPLNLLVLYRCASEQFVLKVSTVARPSLMLVVWVSA